MVYLFCVVTKKIMVEQFGDTKQELRINALAFEDVIDIGSLAIEIAGKPTDGSSLLSKLLFDQLTNMNCRIRHKRGADKSLYPQPGYWTTLVMR